VDGAVGDETSGEVLPGERVANRCCGRISVRLGMLWKAVESSDLDAGSSVS